MIAPGIAIRRVQIEEAPPALRPKKRARKPPRIAPTMPKGTAATHRPSFGPGVLRLTIRLATPPAMPPIMIQPITPAPISVLFSPPLFEASVRTTYEPSHYFL